MLTKQANKPAKKENDKGHSRADSDGKTPEHKKEKAPDKTKK
jgi:hypothetical protein